MASGRGAAVQRQRDTCPLPTLSKRKTKKGKRIERRGTKKGEEKSNDNITLPYPHSYSKKAVCPHPSHHVIAHLWIDTCYASGWRNHIDSYLRVRLSTQSPYLSQRGCGKIRHIHFLEMKWVEDYFHEVLETIPHLYKKIFSTTFRWSFFSLCCQTKNACC